MNQLKQRNDKMIETNEGNEVKIGQKDISNYVYAVLRNSNVTLLARGSNIKKCVDIGLIVSRDYGYSIDDVKIYNSSYMDEAKKERNVSNVEIKLSK